MSCPFIGFSIKLGRPLKILAVAGIAVLSSTAPAWAQAVADRNVNPPELLRDGLEWIQGLGAMGAIAFIALYSVATVAFIPGSILTLGAGVVFGMVQGAIYVFLGASLGATAAFGIGRYLARAWVSQKIGSYPQFKAIDEAIGREGLKIVLLTRLSPVFPFTLLNYALGITGVSLRDYILGFIGMIPGTVLYVYLGSLAGNVAAIGSPSQDTHPGVQWAVRIVGFAATLAVTLYVTQIARKALHQSLPEPASQESPR
ncbi:MAG TPA: TVP38/TMEM64 family protein [Coleofasciculaceae cyanobacterium]